MAPTASSSSLATPGSSKAVSARSSGSRHQPANEDSTLGYGYSNASSSPAIKAWLKTILKNPESYPCIRITSPVLSGLPFRTSLMDSLAPLDSAITSWRREPGVDLVKYGKLKVRENSIRKLRYGLYSTVVTGCHRRVYVLVRSNACCFFLAAASYIGGCETGPSRTQLDIGVGNSRTNGLPV